jgi:hypothetical protein
MNQRRPWTRWIPAYRFRTSGSPINRYSLAFDARILVTHLAGDQVYTFSSLANIFLAFELGQMLSFFSDLLAQS